MLSFKGIVSFFLFFTYAFAPACAQESKKIPVLIYGDSSYPPYSYEENGHPVGIYYDLLVEIFSHFDPKYEIKIRSIDWNKAISDVRTGDIFAIYPPYKTQESRPWMDYSDPLFQENIVVFCHSEKKSWPEDYSKSRVAINHGFMYPPFVTKIFQKYHMQVLVLKNNKLALDYYHKNKVDCYLNDRVAVLYTNKIFQFPPILPFEEKTSLIDEKAYLGFASENFDQFFFKEDFIHQFNIRLSELKKEQKIDKIIDKYAK